MNAIIHLEESKWKPLMLNWVTFSDFKGEGNNKDPGDSLRISKYKIMFLKVVLQIGQKKIFVIKKVKNTVPWTYVKENLYGEEITWTFYEKELQNTNQVEFRIEKVIRENGDKLHAKSRGYDNLFDLWIDKKDII